MTGRIDFVVTGDSKMHCKGCEGRVSFALRRMPGVQAATADSGTQCITVSFDPARVSVEQLHARIRETGFEVEEV